MGCPGAHSSVPAAPGQGPGLGGGRLRRCPSSCACARHVLLYCALAVAVFPAMHTISRHAAPPSSATLHPAPCPGLHRHAALHPPRRQLQLTVHRAPAAVHRAPSPAHAEVMLGCCRCRRSPLEGRGRCRCHGRCDARSQQGDVAMKAHVASICFKCFRCFKAILQLFHMDVAHVAYGVSV
jgi:hypothetical protein